LAEILDVSIEHLLGMSAPKRQGGPTGKLRRVFDQASDLPRAQQQRIIAMIEDMIIAQEAKKTLLLPPAV